MTSTPAVVTLHIWGVSSRSVLRALINMTTQRRAVTRYPGVTFAKLLGTGSGRTFTIDDADVHHWALLTCWDSAQGAGAFERSRSIRDWDRHCTERLRLELAPISSKGQWSGRTPFGSPSHSAHHGPVAALTRARLRATRAMSFWRSVPPVSAALHRSPGLALALGIGEAPVGLQGTFSVWRDSDSLTQFAYRDPRHQTVIARTHEIGWYAEELFARFVVLDHSGTYRGQPLPVT